MKILRVDPKTDGTVRSALLRAIEPLVKVESVVFENPSEVSADTLLAMGSLCTSGYREYPFRSPEEQRIIDRALAVHLGAVLVNCIGARWCRINNDATGDLGFAVEVSTLASDGLPVLRLMMVLDPDWIELRYPVEMYEEFDERHNFSDTAVSLYGEFLESPDGRRRMLYILGASEVVTRD